MSELTKQGYDMIMDRIVNRRIIPPDMFDLDALTAWLNGYSCMNCPYYLVIDESAVDEAVLEHCADQLMRVHRAS